MTIVQIILGASALVFSVALMIIIMIQQGKNDGLGAMAGGNAADAESYFNKNQKRGRDAVLAKLTVIFSVILVGLVIAMNIVG